MPRIPSSPPARAVRRAFFATSGSLAILAHAEERLEGTSSLTPIPSTHLELLQAGPEPIPYATAVVAYEPGTGYATEFGTGLGYTLAESVLGEPSRVTPGEYGGPVDPFNAPYLREQLVSLGAGGSLTVALSARNDASHPYGLDFQIFGGSFFVITNGDYSGGGITDGSTYGGNAGETRVSVSADGIHFYALDPSRARNPDGLFPTRGSGDFQVPVNPALTGKDFARLGLTDIALKYELSGGGTAYDIDWAQSADGTPVHLPAIEYVRVDVVSGRSDLDGFAAIRTVPEPSTWALLAGGLAGILLLGRSPRKP